MDDKLRDKLQCPICLELPEKKIFLCTNGHNICEKCSDTVNVCPQCRLPYSHGKVRNLGMEQVLELYKVECPNKNNGCTEMTFKDKLDEHIKQCTFSGKWIKFCSQIGLNCDQSINIREIEEVVDHFQTTHDFKIQTSEVITVQLKGFNIACKTRQKSFWTPAIFHAYHSTFLLLAMYNGEKEMISWHCVLVTEKQEEARKLQVEFFLKSCSAEDQDLSWRASTVGILNASEHFETPTFQFSTSLLIKKYMTGDGNLLLHMSITPFTATINPWNSDVQPLPLSLHIPLNKANGPGHHAFFCNPGSSAQPALVRTSIPTQPQAPLPPNWCSSIASPQPSPITVPPMPGNSVGVAPPELHSISFFGSRLKQHNPLREPPCHHTPRGRVSRIPPSLFSRSNPSTGLPFERTRDESGTHRDTLDDVTTRTERLDVARDSNQTASGDSAGDVIPCPICGEQFASLERLQSHASTCGIEKVATPDGCFELP